VLDYFQDVVLSIFVPGGKIDSPLLDRGRNLLMSAKIKFDKSSKTVQIHLPDGRVINGPRGDRVCDFLKLVQDDFDAKIVGAIVNGALRELTYPINMESKVIPLTMSSADGMRIYRRSLTMLLETAFTQIYPDLNLNIDHSVSFGGYFCGIRGDASKVDLEILKKRMREIVDANLPITRKEVPLDQAVEYFKRMGQTDKVRLLKHRKKDYLMMYTLDEHQDYHHGYMVPASGYLKWFDLQPADGGFTLRFPRKQSPEEILPLHHYPKLLETFRRYGDWLELLDIDSVGALNDAIDDGRISELVLVSEALHDQHITEIARQISDRRDQIRLVLISGPSSSGKTTSSRRLSIQLLARGLQPFPLELDNYFVDRDKTPKDENGEFDFEHIHALNLDRLNYDLQHLISGEKVTLPKYDFVSGTSGVGEEVQLSSNQIIILEGIHGLNPELVPVIPNEHLFRVYISALTQLNLDHHNRVSTTDTRLIRRIVRDARTRGYTPQETIARWESVRRGEKRYIYPYQENADVMFNSALVYELSALKPLVEPLLRQVPFGCSEHIEVKRLLALLEWFLPIDTEMIPDDSLLREFIGGSILSKFKLWKSR
jgi:uridine kinase